MKEILFYFVVLVANIIQGITGFAGTILALPPGIMLVGIEVARPILNILGIYAGLYVFITQRKHINWKELRKVVIIMFFGILAGIFMKNILVKQDYILYKLLGVFVLGLSISGFLKLKKKDEVKSTDKASSVKSSILLIGAGVVHGIFVSGGPLLIGYFSKTLKDKVQFRATISTVWIVLNTVILLDDIRCGLWTGSLVKIQIITIPFLLVGMIIGTKLYKSMSQLLFMKLTYILLFISGVSLLVK